MTQNSFYSSKNGSNLFFSKSNSKTNNSDKKFHKKMKFLQSYLSQKHIQFSYNSLFYSTPKMKGKEKKKNNLLISSHNNVHNFHSSFTSLSRDSGKIKNHFVNSTDQSTTLQSDILIQKKNSPVLGDEIIGKFFPHKKAFMHYWVLPFVGLAGYVYFVKFQCSNSNFMNGDSNKLISFDTKVSSKFNDFTQKSKNSIFSPDIMGFQKQEETFKEHISNTYQKIQKFEKKEMSTNLSVVNDIPENSTDGHLTTSTLQNELKSEFFLRWLPSFTGGDARFCSPDKKPQSQIENFVPYGIQNCPNKEFNSVTKKVKQYSFFKNAQTPNFLIYKNTESNEKVPKKCSFLDSKTSSFTQYSNRRNFEATKPIIDYKDASLMLDNILKNNVSDSSKFFLNKAQNHTLPLLAEMCENDMTGSDLLNKMEFIMNSVSLLRETRKQEDNSGPDKNKNLKSKLATSFQENSQTTPPACTGRRVSAKSQVGFEMKQTMLENFQNLLFVQYLSNNLKMKSKTFQISKSNMSLLSLHQKASNKVKNSKFQFRNQIHFYKTYLNIQKKEKLQKKTISPLFRKGLGFSRTLKEKYSTKLTLEKNKKNFTSRFFTIFDKIQMKENLQFINQNFEEKFLLSKSDLLKWRIYELLTLRSFLYENSSQKFTNDFQNEKFQISSNLSQLKIESFNLQSKIMLHDSLLKSNFNLKSMEKNEVENQKRDSNSKIENLLLSLYSNNQESQKIQLLSQPPMFYWSLSDFARFPISFVGENTTPFSHPTNLTNVQFGSISPTNSFTSFYVFNKDSTFLTLFQDLKFIEKSYLKFISNFRLPFSVYTTQSQVQTEGFISNEPNRDLVLSGHLGEKNFNSCFFDFDQISLFKKQNDETFYSNFTLRPYHELLTPKGYGIKPSKKYYLLKLKNRSSHSRKAILSPRFFLTRENRKKEKIFRTYLSWKGTSSSNNLSVCSNIDSQSKIQNFVPSKSQNLEFKPNRYFYMKKVLKTIQNQIHNPISNNKKSHIRQIAFFEDNKTASKIGNEFKYPAFQNRHSSMPLLRRIGFLFRYQEDKDKLELQTKDTIRRIEKHRSQQKKRRRKKQKRFYPRPIWSRFFLYKNFLANRHFSTLSISKKTYKTNKIEKQENLFPSLETKQKFFKSKTFEQGAKISPHINVWGEAILSHTRENQKKNVKINTTKETTQIYRNNKRVSYSLLGQDLNSFGVWHKSQRHSNSKLLRSYKERKENLKIRNSVEKIKTLNHHEYYKISNQVMSDFQKLCWKSYWLRTSLNPYIERIQSSFQNMLSASLLQDEVTFSLFNKKDERAVFGSDWRDKTPVFNSSSDFHLFQNIQHRAEYDRILYDRISDIILNVKSNLGSTESTKGLTQGVQSFKIGRSKKENIALRLPYAMNPNKSNSTNSTVLNQQKEDQFWYKFGLFINNNLNVPSVRAFSLESQMDNSIKPFGEIPTLRALWALNHTNILTNENPKIQLMNENQKLWSTLKLRQQNTSNKTKKFFYTTWKKLSLRPFMQKETDTTFTKEMRSNFAGQGQKFVQTQILNELSLQKLEIAEKKLAYLGIRIKTNKAKLKYLKMKFQALPKEGKIHSHKSIYSYNPIQSLRSETENNSVNNVESQRLSKRSIQFWWSFSSFSGQHKTFLNFPDNPTTFYSPDAVKSSTFDRKIFYDVDKSLMIFMTSLWGCTLLFHLCSLFAFLQISEIRSLGKFYLLILYKLSNSYLILTYAIFDLLKNYLNQITSVLSVLKTMRKSKNKQKRENQDTTFFYTKTKISSSPFYTGDKQNLASPDQKSQSKIESFTPSKNTKSFMQNEEDKDVSVMKYVATNRNFTSSNFTNLTEKNSFSNLKQNQFNKSFVFTKVYYQIHSHSLIHSNGKFFEFGKKDGMNETNFTSLFEMYFYLPNTLQFSSAIGTRQKIQQKIQGAKLSPNINVWQGDSSSFVQSQTQSFYKGTSPNYTSTPQSLIESLTPVFGNFKVQKNFIFSSLKNRNRFIYSFLYSNFQFYSKTLNYFKNGQKQNKNQKNFLKNKQNQFLFNMKIIIQKLYSFIWVGILSVSKMSISAFYDGLGFLYSCAFKVIDMFEGGMLLIYKFLEKPAEFMIDWIAQLFLVEWSSDIPSFVPESFDIYTWRSFTKISRGSRIFSLFGFLLQRRLWCFFEIFLNLFTKPDSDLRARQRKGIIFWDVWAEILMIAAEKYRINLSSLTTVKEEQDAFLERLLNDPNWLSSKTIDKEQNINQRVIQEKQTRAFVELELFASHGQRPESWVLHPQTRLSSQTSIGTSFFDLKEKNNLYQNFNLASFNDQTFGMYGRNLNKIQEKQNSLFFGTNQMNSISGFGNSELEFISSFQQNWKVWQRWAANQHFTSQGTDTELFIDVHPPKSFVHLSSLKSVNSGISGLQTLGSLTCQIYSGLFSKQVSKNILIVGSPGNTKSQFVHALAGETELKIIADNAYRYAHIQRGIAVGMKLLRDVFDGLALHTPCLFLMEDIHVIGERRPMLISDNENAKAAEAPFTAENEEVHEKNQFIYQLNKHAISDFRKPYKGDFSLLIPTNHFCFDLFLGVSPPKVRFNNQKAGKTPRSPFALETKFFLQNQGASSKSQNGLNQNQKSSSYVLKSLLQFPSEQFFAPPATSPFTILGMKEQREFKPTQIVKEMPWGGFSNDQIMLIPKVTYSIRAKIALLADFALNQLSVKLDMITDLLVIMDNVRSNRGFVVFATTHIPFVLDPALRRPGRLDETISLPFLPTLIDRFEILKSCNFISNSSSVSSFREETSFSNDFLAISTNPIHSHNPIDLKIVKNLQSSMKFSTQKWGGTIDFMSYSFLFQNSSETELSNIMLKAKLLLFQKNQMTLTKNEQNLKSNKEQTKKITRKNRLERTGIYSLNQALSIMTQSEIFDPYKVFSANSSSSTDITVNRDKNKIGSINSDNLNEEKGKIPQSSIENFVQKMNNGQFKNLISNRDKTLIPLSSSTPLAVAYGKIATFLIQSQILKDSRSFRSLVPSFISNGEEFIQEGEQTIFRNLYSPSIDMQHTLMYLLSSKVGEFFVFRQFNRLKEEKKNEKQKNKKLNIKNTTFIRPNVTNFTMHTGLWNMSTTNAPNYEQMGSKFESSSRIQSVGMEEFWSSATSFVFSILQKRYLYNKTLLTNRFLYFNDISTLKEPPTPPGSTILMFGKKYENFKRTERDFQQKSTSSIFEKIQLHQQQRYMKNLYERPILEVFRSEMVQGRSTSFNSSMKELGYYDDYMRKPSSSNSYYKSRILTRQRFSFVNQWWNGQLAEHNLETTFKSDVDWRSMFVESFGDLVIDFPDADQHYNPKLRRWFLQSTYGGYWQSFEKTISAEIYQHYILFCFNKALNYLETERELIDSFAYTYLRKGSFTEIDLISNLSKFYIS